MDRQPRILRFPVMAVVAMALAGFAVPVRPADAVPLEDLQAAARTLGFLDSLPRGGSLQLGVVYASGADAEEAARLVVRRIETVPGPNAVSLHAEPIAAADLARFPGRLDAVFLMPGAVQDSAGLQQVLRSRQLPSISDDPGCLEKNCCVLMVRGGRRVEIVLDTALADAVGARFSPVFMMMVTRR